MFTAYAYAGGAVFFFICQKQNMSTNAYLIVLTGDDITIKLVRQNTWDWINDLTDKIPVPVQQIELKLAQNAAECAQHGLHPYITPRDVAREQLEASSAGNDRAVARITEFGKTDNIVTAIRLAAQRLNRSPISSSSTGKTSKAKP